MEKLTIDKPVIGITCEKIDAKSQNSEVNRPEEFKQFHLFTKLILEAGGIPLLIATYNINEIDKIYEYTDGMLFPGGLDIHPQLYNQDVLISEPKFSKDYDNAEIYLMRKTLKDNKPILGICRGCQMLNIALGGTLYQDLEVQKNTSLHIKKPLDWKSKIHDFAILKETKLDKILNLYNLTEVNSLHHQAVKDLGKGLRVSALAPDGVIECVELEDFNCFVMGIQAHPEVLSEDDKLWKNIFLEFVNSCKI